jgi:glycosyltransferase involved in cell wall biosynthesis
MKLSCIITTRNRRDSTLQTLAHLEKETALPQHDWEILVVDNGSTDGTADAVAGNRRVKVISLAENEGVPARNLALAHARGKYVAFLGDNVRPIGRALPTAIKYLARHPKVAVVVGRVVLPDGSADAPALPAVLMGGASIVRKTVLDSIGGFAAEFFRQAADYELSFRIWRAGYRIERFEDLLFSSEPQTDCKPSALACRMDLRNNLILCERYLPRPLRQAYRRDWMRRYALLARHGSHNGNANAALKEARIWARREAAVGRKTLGADAIESIFQLEAQREAVARWAKANQIRRVCIADWGKNLFATWQACRAVGLKIEAILDHTRAFAGTTYRKTPIIPDMAADPRNFDGILLSTVNPAQVDNRAAELESRFAKPVLRLWEPTLLSAPLPNNLNDQPGNTLPKIDKAA